MWNQLARRASSLWNRQAVDPLAAYWPRLAEIRAAQGAEKSVTHNITRAVQAIERTLPLRPFDVQILGALVMADGKIAEMQTGEGKTLTAVMTVAHLAAQKVPVHVLTANDYLARRDAEWMRPAYRDLGLTVGFLTQTMPPEERRRAYQCDVLYATPNEVGFDFLRDSLALTKDDLVQREFGAALIDEADSILIDEARIPLVIAAGDAAPRDLIHRIANIARALHSNMDYRIDEHARQVVLNDSGAAKVEAALGCENLYEECNLALYTAVIDALHAEALLRRDVDYLVRDGRIDLVDEWKGRVANDRRWPAGLQTALEAKEGLELRGQGRILGSITLQSLSKLYSFLCGMTGTALTQAGEFQQVYGLDVVSIPTNRPAIRVDQPDRIYPTRVQRDEAVIDEIARSHASGRPVLVGTDSVASSDRLSAQIRQAGIQHEVLNARDDAHEAAIVARAGQRGAVTISTNMAGRGTDIQLGEEVPALGGLYVLGTCRHEARRIDNQLRGRAGRQGDPGESRFLLSLEDDLMRRFSLEQVLRHTPDPAAAMDHLQRVIEGENLEVRKMLLKYDGLTEHHRQVTWELRHCVLTGDRDCSHPRLALLQLDELWSAYLASVGELKSGIHWISFGGKNPLDTFLHNADSLFAETLAQMEDAVDDPMTHGVPEGFERGATWTYLTTDQPLGDMAERFLRGVARMIQKSLAAPL